MIVVLLSTYNGEQYLREQIDSILNQKNVELKLIVRDDGSTDGTKAILDNYKQKHLLEWYSGSNLGPANSFHKLLTDAPQADFYALADQDDIWFEDKLHTAVEQLGQHSTPAMYISQTQMVDSNGQVLSTPKLTPNLTFGESLVYAFATGCTMVMNNAMRTCAVKHDTPSFVLHDQWYYVLAQAIGATICFDSNAHIFYRQHTRNVEGLNKTVYTLWKERLARIWNGEQKRSRLASYLLETMGSQMNAEKRAKVMMFVEAKKNISQRLMIVSSSTFLCGSPSTQRLFKLAVLLNTY